jgi:hypothetical protein
MQGRKRSGLADRRQSPAAASATKQTSGSVQAIVGSKSMIASGSLNDALLTFGVTG